jgi:hypothetical protein
MAGRMRMRGQADNTHSTYHIAWHTFDITSATLTSTSTSTSHNSTFASQGKLNCIHDHIHSLISTQVGSYTSHINQSNQIRLNQIKSAQTIKHHCTSVPQRQHSRVPVVGVGCGPRGQSTNQSVNKQINQSVNQSAGSFQSVGFGLCLFVGFCQTSQLLCP